MNTELLKELLLRDSKIINIETVKPELLKKVLKSIKEKGENMGKKIYLYKACKKCRNWLSINILMDGCEGDENITVYRCKYHIPETLTEDEPNFVDIIKCSMQIRSPNEN